MLRFLTQERSSSGLLTRREWLRLGGLTSLGLTGAFSTRALGRQSSSSGTGFGKAQSSDAREMLLIESQQLGVIFDG